MTTADKVLYLLKTRGAQTAQQLADVLAVTSMGARRHLEAAAERGWVQFEDVADKVGRPSRHWSLTEAGHARFPDRHGELTVQLIDQVRNVFGEEGLGKLIRAREKNSESLYRELLAGQDDLRQRVHSLAAARSAEGYMAEAIELEGGAIGLVENHCPICAAARQCPNFCRSELDVFRRVLGRDYNVERSEHLLEGARRCVYVIKPLV